MGVKYNRKKKTTKITIKEKDKKGTVSLTKKNLKNKCPKCGGIKCCRMRNV